MMRKFPLVALLAFVASGAIAPTAPAKEFGTMGAAGGVTVSGSPYRYIAIAPGRPDRLTVVERIDRRGGRVSRWWYLKGGFYVPAVAYDGSPGGLSADGTTLVLTQFPDYYLHTPTTRLAILRTGRVIRPPGWHRPRPWVRFVDLKGDFSVDAISPDGSTVFLVRYLEPARPGARLGAREVRALDTASGRLLRGPVVATEEPRGREHRPRDEALPISGATSPNGRWAYTLYGGNRQALFIEALDTRRRAATTMGLPQLKNRRSPFLLKLRMEDEGRRIVVLERSPIQGGRSLSLLRVNTRSLEVHKNMPAATASGGSPPWLPIGLGAGAILLAISWGLGSRRKASGPPPMGQA
jgi:hypothetical protein